jgi:hypothetical protein
VGVVGTPSGTINVGLLLTPHPARAFPKPPFPNQSPENPHIRMVLDTISPPPYPWHSSGRVFSQERRIRGFLGKTGRSDFLERVINRES